MVIKKEQLAIMAQNIKMVEIRIYELEIALRLECKMSKKVLMQSSLKANREVLALLKHKYWELE